MMLRIAIVFKVFLMMSARFLCAVASGDGSIVAGSTYISGNTREMCRKQGPRRFADNDVGCDADASGGGKNGVGRVNRGREYEDWRSDVPRRTKTAPARGPRPPPRRSGQAANKAVGKGSSQGRTYKVRLHRLHEKSGDDVAGDIREPIVASLESVGEFQMIQSEE